MAKTTSMDMPVMGEPNRYPYGLAISLTHEELEKLGLDADCEVGDCLMFDAMAKVTSVSKMDTAQGASCRVELQITHLSLEGDDDNDGPEMSRLYK